MEWAFSKCLWWIWNSQPLRSSGAPRKIWKILITICSQRPPDARVGISSSVSIFPNRHRSTTLTFCDRISCSEGVRTSYLWSVEEKPDFFEKYFLRVFPRQHSSPNLTRRGAPGAKLEIFADFRPPNQFFASNRRKFSEFSKFLRWFHKTSHQPYTYQKLWQTELGRSLQPVPREIDQNPFRNQGKPLKPIEKSTQNSKFTLNGLETSSELRLL